MLRARWSIDGYDDPQLEAWLFGMLMGTNADWWFDEYDPNTDEDYLMHLVDLAESGLEVDDYAEYLLFEAESDNEWRRYRASLQP